MTSYPSTWRSRCRWILVATALIAHSGTAQVRRASAARADTAPSVRVDPRSPRAAVADFLNLTKRGQFEAAGQYMGPGLAADRRAELARRLKAVLDQRLWIEVDDLSPLASGDTADGLRADREQVGTIANDAGVRQPLQLQRAAAGAEPAWYFEPRTIARIDEWYDALADRWLRDHMPLALQRPGPFGVDLWQWVALALMLPIALGIGWILDRLTIAIARRAARRTETRLDDLLIDRIAPLLLSIWTIAVFRALVGFAGLSIEAEKVVGLLARALIAVLVTWLFIRATHVLEEELPSSPWAVDKPEMRSLVPLLGRVFRIFLLAVGAIAFVAQFGYSVATLLAGLGIGGIAVALAMQKTLEHLLGSVAIGLDQPIRVGDWVKVGDAEGEVEAIGLRSTRLRTMERSLIVLPNGRLADMQMENFGVRDRILLKTTLRLAYGTTAAQVRRVRDDVERLLTEHPLIWRDRVIVRFTGFAATSLDVEVIAWVATTDYNVFRAAREEIYLRLMQIVENAGSAIALPTQAVYVRHE